MTILAGVDIGGTKCAVTIGKVVNDNDVQIIVREMFPTPPTPKQALDLISDRLTNLVATHKVNDLQAIGISCGGPLDSNAGLVLSPPNLPGWDKVNVVQPLKRLFQVPVALENDANACALAEWQWGAGKGLQNVIFLTFGTGMGAGLVLDGRLYRGTNGMAGEVGHIRLSEDGPIGYGKHGSFEGFCSGGGIARLAKNMAKNWVANGRVTALGTEGFDQLTAKDVGLAAQAGDELALQVFETVGRRLGQGLSILVDILNPERIIIGSIYLRQEQILAPVAESVLQKEALSCSLDVCQVVPAGLGERVGDYASLSVALYTLHQS